MLPEPRTEEAKRTMLFMDYLKMSTMFVLESRRQISPVEMAWKMYEKRFNREQQKAEKE